MARNGPHITASVPLPEGGRERVEARAVAIHDALTLAATDPEFRLRMILGEANSEYQTALYRLAAKLREDDKKAPGLLALARQAIANPLRFEEQGVPAVALQMLSDAFLTPALIDEDKQIEAAPCAET